MESEVTTIPSTNSEGLLGDNFKPVFKKYKRRGEKLDLSGVIDFQLDEVCEKFSLAAEHHVKEGTHSDSDICEGLGLEPVDSWRCFSLKSAPGFIFICNPFQYGCQKYWLRRLLKDIPNPTNKTNIEGGLPFDGKLIWDQHVNSAPDTKKSLYKRLRWVTFGYHHNWDTKIYDPDDASPFPEDVGLLSAFIASRFGFIDFEAQAAIANYYNMDSTLGGHNDHSELDHTAPLISMSFGQSAIFLVGGLTKAVAPTPLRLRSGDVVFLSSTSRLAFHGVPRIFHESKEYLQRCWGKNPTQDATAFPQSCRDEQCSLEDVTGKEDSSIHFPESAVDKERVPQDDHADFPNHCTSGKRESRSGTANSVDGQPMSVKKNRVDTQGDNGSFRSRFPNTARIMQQVDTGQRELNERETWAPFQKYLLNARLNVSIRQVNVQRNSAKQTGEGAPGI